MTQLKKNVKIPIILFPGNITGISPETDAILFNSLLNSENPYYITGAQAQGALVINKYNLEAIPTGYLIIGDGSTAWFMGQAKSIPFNKSNIVVMRPSSTLHGYAIFISRSRLRRITEYPTGDGKAVKNSIKEF